MRSLVVVAALACVARADQPLVPPLAPKVPHTLSLHGLTLDDEYFWLREKGTPRVDAHLRAEADYAAAFMKPTRPLQEKLYAEMLARIQEDDSTAPYKRGNYYYFTKTIKSKEYRVHCRKPTLDGKEAVLLDLNELLGPNKYIGVSIFQPTDDGRLLAYASDVTGFREYTLYVKDLESGALGPEKIPQVDSAAWADGKTLFYTVMDKAKRPHRLYRHTLGAKDDVLVYEEKDERFRIWVDRSRSRQFLFLTSRSATQSEVRVLAAAQPAGEWRMVAPRAKDFEYYLDHRGDRFFIRTNDQGRNFRVVSAPTADPRRESWKEVFPHRPLVMVEAVIALANHLILSEREDGLPQLRVTDLRTNEQHRVSFPEAVYYAAAQDNFVFDTETLRFNYQSFVTPPSVYDYDLKSRERKLIKRLPVLGGYDPERYESERLRARADDGTEIFISIVHKKGFARDGKAPLLLYGYGSYGAAGSAWFDANRFSLVDRGVTWAVAHVRGGGELGKKWHDDGRMMKKRNTFTDFIRAAEHLVREKYTASDRLAIQGISAGGLLIGAVLNLRPDLFKVALAQVPFVDVINTMLDESLPLTVGEFEEWGNPKKKDEFDYMRSYSPYDNVAKKSYPSLLVTSSINDSQVMYWEPAKWVAKLRALKTDKNPLVFRINLDPSGHGGKGGRYEQLRERAFDFAFVLTQLGVAD